MDYINIFKALSNNIRVRIFHLLSESEKELCICEIMDALVMTQYNISKHIKELKNAGLVKENREGRFVFYSLIPPDNKMKEYILKAVSSLEKRLFKEDNMKLKKRLSLRKNGKPVLATCKCKGVNKT